VRRVGEASNVSETHQIGEAPRRQFSIESVFASLNLRQRDERRTKCEGRTPLIGRPAMEARESLSAPAFEIPARTVQSGWRRNFADKPKVRCAHGRLQTGPIIGSEIPFACFRNYWKLLRTHHVLEHRCAKPIFVALALYAHRKRIVE